MTEHKDQKTIIRERMAKTGESYTTARRQVVHGTSPDATAAGSSWREIRGLVKRLEELIGELDSGSCFSLAPKPKDTFDPREGTPSLSNEWRIGIVSTVGLLANYFHIDREVALFHSTWAEFSWATPANINENPYVKQARDMIRVGRKLLAAVDSVGSN